MIGHHYLTEVNRIVGLRHGIRTIGSSGKEIYDRIYSGYIFLHFVQRNFKQPKCLYSHHMTF